MNHCNFMSEIFNHNVKISKELLKKLFMKNLPTRHRDPETIENEKCPIIKKSKQYPTALLTRVVA